jgi:hypothetical protein
MIVIWPFGDWKKKKIKLNKSLFYGIDKGYLKIDFNLSINYISYEFNEVSKFQNIKVSHQSLIRERLWEF